MAAELLFLDCNVGKVILLVCIINVTHKLSFLLTEIEVPSPSYLVDFKSVLIYSVIENLYFAKIIWIKLA